MSTTALKLYKGQIFGWLTVIKRHPIPTAARKVRWICKCQCGNKTIAVSSKLTNGSTQSCGCKKGWIHGWARTDEYKIWSGIRQRCQNPDNCNYHKYGGRGIKVCYRWNNFEKFLEDMGPRPSSRHSIDRKNTNKHYTPKNCRWVLPTTQSNNRYNTVYLTLDGTTLPLTEWGRKLKINRNTLGSRRRLGWSDEEILTTPVRI